MLTLTCCQDHILTENIWFVWSETSYSGDERRCYRCGTTKQTLKIELLSQWKLEAEFRNSSLVYMKSLPMHFHFVFLVGCILTMIALKFYTLVHRLCVIVEATSVIVFLFTFVTLKHFPITVEHFPIQLLLHILHCVCQCYYRMLWFIGYYIQFINFVCCLSLAAV